MIADPKTMTRWMAQAGLALLASTGLHAATTNISQTPLVTASGAPVKPNLMFNLDDSGSMSDTYLPEAANGSGYSLPAAQCNGLAFDPASSYPPALQADGVTTDGNAAPSTAYTKVSGLSGTERSLSPSSFAIISSGALPTVKPQGGTPSSSWYTVGKSVTVYDSGDANRWMTGTVTSWDKNTRELVINITFASVTGTLSNAVVRSGAPTPAYYTYGGTQPKLGYAYDGSGGVVSNTFYNECFSAVGSSPGSTVFTPVYLAASSNASLLQSYANWLKYYRTRMDMMKTVVSYAFKDIDDKFRVGFTLINNKKADETLDAGGNITDMGFLHVRDFDGNQKVKFYAALKATTPGPSTPLRGAIAKVGQYFARKAPGQSSSAAKDPIQYSCQKNFTILATDGAWNTGSESTNAPKYGPYKLDNSTSVGQQDGTAARPMTDANGSSDSLADVAMYYYNTDLRDKDSLDNCAGAIAGVDVCENNVVGLGDDTATWQHLSTYTMSLGQSGTLKYAQNYKTQTSGDFYDIKQGTKNWPAASSGSGSAIKMDDLWHAAVNGRGTFFNVSDPTAVALGLKTALSAIQQITASGSAAATSTLKPVPGDNQVFVAKYTSSAWTGDLCAYRLDTETGNPLMTTGDCVKDNPDWSAASRLKVNANRKIYYAGAGKTLREFTYANLTADGLSALVDNKCGQLSQCAILSGADKTSANSGSNLVSYLRGAELSYFRSRAAMLGDIVGSAPFFVGASKSSMTDDGYLNYKNTQVNRKGVVYVGSNDGMLHAFDASTGDELWAFIPTAVRSDIYKLADMSFTTDHRYFVDGSPVVADVSAAGSWRTIMVFGLGAGGKSYIAMDVTSPSSPQLLWEFTDANLGYTVAKPLIVKRKTGEWVVVVPSGYNNIGDGKGHMFVLSAVSGQLLADLSTSAGDTDTPSGLGPIRAWGDKNNDYTASRYYAGDLLGNVWRFDLDGLVDPKHSAMLLAQLKVGSTPQPITTAPELALVDQKGFTTPAVFVGTGMMLGLPDLSSTAQQTIYGIKDTLAATGLGDVRGSGKLVKQALSTSGTVRKAESNPVDWSAKNGWYVDLPDAGERINVGMQMSGSTLLAASNVPQSVASCSAGGGYSWLYYLNIATGSNTGTDVATKVADSMIVGFTKTSKGVLVQRSTKPLENKKVPQNKIYLKKANKTSWRELAG
ncbi:pilus assembly protein [Paucibacter soli]|uniref:pilus assembly protein n=1 Tax=Paucibacter soli TaxID=3133433 RepID=UPI0030B37728